MGFSVPIAAAAIAFATYFFRALSASPISEFTVPFLGVNILTISPITILAAGIVIIFSLIHYHSLFLGTRVQNGLTVFKIGLIAIFVVAGLFVGHGSTGHFSGGLNMSSVFQNKFAISLIFISFAYSGWNAAAYLGGEIKRPSRNIPLALFTGTFLVMCLYLILNVVYIYALHTKEMSGVLEVGAKSAISLFGDNIGKYFSGAIAIGLLSVLSAMIMTGPRVYYAMAKDSVFFELFGNINKVHRTPAYAILLQAAIAVVMVVTASFDKLLIYRFHSCIVRHANRGGDDNTQDNKTCFEKRLQNVRISSNTVFVHLGQSLDHLFFHHEQAHRLSVWFRNNRFRHLSLSLFQY